jgi:hypothetical protein
MLQESLKQLHHLTTTGVTITDGQRAELEDWYAQQDDAEHSVLNLSGVNVDLESLKIQVEAVLTQLLTAAKRMQDLSAENDDLRRDLAFLRQQLTTTSALQTA